MLSRIFPAPRFLSMGVCGLDISSHMLRFIELVPESRLATDKKSHESHVRSFIPIHWGSQILPEGVIVGGEIIRKDELVKALVQFKEKYNLSFVKVSLPEYKAYLFKTVVPTTEESELADAAAFTLEENVPIPGPEALIEWDIVEKRPHETALSVSVFPRDVATLYRQVVEAAGLIPVSFDVKMRAMTKAVIPAHDSRTFLIVSIGETKTLFCVVSNGVAQFTSTIFSGAAAFTSVIQKYQNSTPEEAKIMKYSHNFLQGKEEDHAIQQEFLTILEGLNKEIRRIYTYWYMRKDNDETSRKINTIMIMGEDALMPGLVDYVSAHQDVPVELANAWENCFSLNEYIPEIPFEEAVHYSIAIGLALP